MEELSASAAQSGSGVSFCNISKGAVATPVADVCAAPTIGTRCENSPRTPAKFMGNVITTCGATADQKGRRPLLSSLKSGRYDTEDICQGDAFTSTSIERRILTEDEAVIIAQKAVGEHVGTVMFWGWVNFIMYLFTLVWGAFLLWFAFYVFRENCNVQREMQALMPTAKPYGETLLAHTGSLSRIARDPLELLSNITTVHVRLPREREAILPIKAIVRDTSLQETFVQTDSGVQIKLSPESGTVVDTDGSVEEFAFEDHGTYFSELGFRDAEIHSATAAAVQHALGAAEKKLR